MAPRYAFANFTVARMMRYLLYVMYLVIAACGGSNGNGRAGDENGVGNIPSGNARCVPGSQDSNIARLTTRTVDEIEPNNEVSTAHPVDLPIPDAPEDLVGFVVEGSVHDLNDLTDIFSFTSSRTRRIFFKLCESSCNTRSDTDFYGNPDSLINWSAYIKVLDADGVAIASTEFDNPIENFAEVCVDAGVVMYVAVHAGNTLNADQPYQVSAFEMVGY